MTLALSTTRRIVSLEKGKEDRSPDGERSFAESSQGEKGIASARVKSQAGKDPARSGTES